MPYHAILTGLLLATEESGEPTGSLLGLLLPLIIFGGLFYVALILPQRRRQRQMQELRDSVVVGDQIRTIGGILGRVTGIEVERKGEATMIAAAKGVILASGGFEWNREMMARYFPGEPDFQCLPIWVQV